MTALALRHQSFQPRSLSAHRRQQASRGVVECWVHEGPHLDHCLEVRTTGAIGTVIFTRQNLDEMKRAIAEAERMFDLLDDRAGTPYLRPPEKLVF